MSQNVGVILSGCGFQDGSEIYETVLTLLHLQQEGASIQCFAPNCNQGNVIDHASGEHTDETRSAYTEAARLARSEIQPLNELNADNFDTVILPGGFGAASTLSDFAEAGENCEVQPDVLRAIDDMTKVNKPVGFICIAPVIAAKLYQDVKVTIGNNAEVASKIEAMGAQHIQCAVDDIVVDHNHRVVTTPAYMLGPTMVEVSQGIHKLVRQILQMAQ